MIKDGYILKRLQESNKLKDTELVKRIENLLSLKRVLDKKPGKIKINISKDIKVSGLRASFISTFNNLYVAEYENEVALLDVAEITHSNAAVTCDYCVFVVLHTLILIGVSKCEDIVYAIRGLFVDIVMSSNLFITKQQMYTVLTAAHDDYYRRVLDAVILELLYTNEDVLRYHVSTRLQDEIGNIQYLNTLLEHYRGKTVKDFDKTIKEDAKRYRKCEYRLFVYRENELSVVARTLLEKEITVTEILNEYVQDIAKRKDALSKYSELTPRKFYTEVEKLYKRKNKKKAEFEEMVRAVCG